MSRGISRDQLIDAIHELADETDGTPTRTEMDDDGRYSSNPYYTEFGNWNSALEAAGYAPNQTSNNAGNVLTKSDLLEELRRLADDLERPPRKKDMTDDGEYSYQPYYNHFDGWNDALEKAGLGTNHEYRSDDELVDELQRVADEIGRSPTFEEFNDRSELAASTCANRFGSWLEAREKAGLSGTGHQFERKLTPEELLAEFKRVGDLVGRAPTKAEVREYGRHSAQAYYRRFDTLRDALERAGYDLDAPDRTWPDDYPSDWLDRAATVRERDGHECIVCGTDSDEHDEKYNQKLHVHHVHCEDDDPNALKNLVTLCSACHKKWDRVKTDPRDAPERETAD